MSQMKFCKKCGRMFFPNWGSPSIYCNKCRAKGSLQNIGEVVDKIKDVISNKK